MENDSIKRYRCDCKPGFTGLSRFSIRLMSNLISSPFTAETILLYIHIYVQFHLTANKMPAKFAKCLWYMYMVDSHESDAYRQKNDFVAQF